MILDAGPLIAVDRNRRALAALMAAAIEAGETLRTSEAIVSQVWRTPRQANLAAALAAIDIDPGFGDGLLGSTGTSDPIDAHLAEMARRLHQPLLTSDIDDFARLAAHTGVRVVAWRG